MKILCLYNNECALELFEDIKKTGHTVVPWNKRLDTGWCKSEGFDLAVSYTYRYILTAGQLAALGNNVVNIHNSYLPWNRGADPNIWSIIDQTPRGVTLHYMNADLDRGDIIAQTLISDIDLNTTLEDSYYNLDKAAKKLFMDSLMYYDSWQYMRKKALGKGSYHSVNDGRYVKELIMTYKITVEELRLMLKESNLGDVCR